MGKVGAKATRASRIFDGRWVNTIVLSRPKRRASGAAARNESAERRFAPKNRAESVVSGTPKRRWKKSAIRLCTTSPPASASTLKSALSRHTMPRERPNGGASRSQRGFPSMGARSGASTAPESRGASQATTRASTAYAPNRRRMPVMRGRCRRSSRSGNPATSAPTATLSEATML